MITTVIFDMDGVIADSEPYHKQAETELLSANGIEINLSDLDKYTGRSYKFMFEDWIKRYGLSVSVGELYDKKMKKMFSLMKGKVKPIRGVTETIQQLKEKEIKICVASSSPRELVYYTLNEFGILSSFDAIVTFDDITYAKPNPEIFLKAASLVNETSKNCVVIEDAESGIEAAKSAGMKCIGLKIVDSGNQDLSKADMMINSFEQLSVNEIVSMGDD